MHLNLQTDFALRILMALAASGGQMSVEEIARSYGVSRNHLAKIAQRLQAMGYVTASRGRTGGLRLARAPEDVNVGTIVRSLESLNGFVECLAPTESGCPVNGLCGLKGALNAALGDFLTRLDRYTLADLLPDRNRFFAQLTATRPEIPA